MNFGKFEISKNLYFWHNQRVKIIISINSMRSKNSSKIKTRLLKLIKFDFWQEFCVDFGQCSRFYSYYSCLFIIFSCLFTIFQKNCTPLKPILALPTWGQKCIVSDYSKLTFQILIWVTLYSQNHLKSHMSNRSSDF